MLEAILKHFSCFRISTLILGLRGLGRANFMPEKVFLAGGGVEDGETEKISLYEIIDHWPLPKNKKIKRFRCFWRQCPMEHRDKFLYVCLSI